MLEKDWRKMFTNFHACMFGEKYYSKYGKLFFPPKYEHSNKITLQCWDFIYVLQYINCNLFWYVNSFCFAASSTCILQLMIMNFLLVKFTIICLHLWYFFRQVFLLKSYVISRILDIHVEEKGPRRKRFWISLLCKIQRIL